MFFLKVKVLVAQETSEKVKEEVFLVFLPAKMIADTASLELVAKGMAMKEMKKEGMLVAAEKLSTASTRGSANTTAIPAPRRRRETAFRVTHLGFSTTSESSSPLASCRYPCSSVVL